MNNKSLTDSESNNNIDNFNDNIIIILILNQIFLSLYTFIVTITYMSTVQTINHLIRYQRRKSVKMVSGSGTEL